MKRWRRNSNLSDKAPLLYLHVVGNVKLCFLQFPHESLTNRMFSYQNVLTKSSFLSESSEDKPVWPLFPLCNWVQGSKNSTWRTGIWLGALLIILSPDLRKKDQSVFFFKFYEKMANIGFFFWMKQALKQYILRKLEQASYLPEGRNAAKLLTPGMSSSLLSDLHADKSALLPSQTTALLLFSQTDMFFFSLHPFIPPLPPSLSASGRSSPLDI